LFHLRFALNRVETRLIVRTQIQDGTQIVVVRKDACGAAALPEPNRSRSHAVHRR
jgi:hypothetical protein